ncbi:ABC transporter ATP-binding protein YtrB [Clostridiales bacterium CHKCI006]|nr:ABC transporter ATP-binding protein YtrB [Clostridiales bacterium CHKCI006]
MNRIQISNISKQYKDIKALDHIYCTFESGRIYGLLGRNGAGKSTLINIIANRIFASEGEITIDGLPSVENMAIHEKIYCMSEADLYDSNLKVKDLFKWTSRFYDHFDLDQAFEIAARFHLDVNKRFKSLSKGYQSIFKLTIALSLDLPYIIFDEPVLGLDANHRELFYSLLLKNYEQRECTYIIATHLIEEVAHLIEDVVLIDQGKILLQDSVEHLLQNAYCVSGFASEVDQYCLGKEVLGQDTLGGMKIAYIKGQPQASEKLQFSPINLQKLFVKLTERSAA